MNRASNCAAFAILFLSGFNMALPAFSWATPIEIVHGVFLDNALLCVYLVILVSTGATAVLTRNVGAVRFAALVALLASFGIISAGVNPYRLYDVGQAMRLFLFGAFVLLAAHWSASRGGPFVLRPYLLGIAAGGVLNLYFSFAQPDVIVGFLPTLRSRNGAGGPLAIAISLGAWLMMLRRTRLDALVAIAVSMVGLCAAAISYSKTSMSIGMCGVLAWLFVVLRGASRGRLGLMGTTGFAAALAATVYVARSGEAPRYAAEVIRYGALKVSGFDISSNVGGGDRYMYFLGVGEILASHPLTGVSYGGFYDAITHTAAYRSGEASDEDPSVASLGLANPHNSFLYYASANGVPGLLVVCAVFIGFLGALYRSLGDGGLSGRGVWVWMAAGYFIYAMTLPTLFDTAVLYVPAAVAIAMTVRERSCRSEGPHGAGVPAAARVHPLGG